MLSYRAHCLLQAAPPGAVLQSREEAGAPRGAVVRIAYKVKESATAIRGTFPGLQRVLGVLWTLILLNSHINLSSR